MSLSAALSSLAARAGFAPCGDSHHVRMREFVDLLSDERLQLRCVVYGRVSQLGLAGQVNIAELPRKICRFNGGAAEAIVLVEIEETANIVRNDEIFRNIEGHCEINRDVFASYPLSNLDHGIRAKGMADQDDMRIIAVLMTRDDIMRNLIDICPAPKRHIAVALRLQLRSHFVHAGGKNTEQAPDQVDLRVLLLRCPGTRMPLLRPAMVCAGHKQHCDEQESND